MLVVALLLAIWSLLPVRWTGWVRWFSGPILTIVTPISHPAASVSRWLSPARSGRDDDAVRVLEDELERAKSLYLAAQRENERLERLLGELRVGSAVTPDAPLRQVATSVIGVPSELGDILRIRAGTRHGVVVGDAAVAEGLQLIGRVVRVSARTSEVRLLSSKAGEAVRARIVTEESSGAGLDCLLVPAGDGTLSGPVEAPPSTPGAPARVAAVGQSVRLSDEARWPRNAQMLLIGRVESVRPDPDQPLRTIVVVRPSMTIDRVRDVIVRTSGEEAEDER